MIHSSLYAPLLEALAKRATAFRYGDTRRRDISNGPLINAAAVARYEKAIEDGRAAGRLVFGGERLSGGMFDHGNFVGPAILANLPADHRLFRD